MQSLVKKKIRILFLIPHLGGGGAERVITLVANNLSPERFEVHLALVKLAEDQYRDPVADSVTAHRLGARRLRNGLLPLYRLIHRLEPDVVLSCITHLNFAVLLLRPFLPRRLCILVRQESTASAAFHELNVKLLYRWIYSTADRIICQSEAMARDLTESFGIPRKKQIVLYNPVSIRDPGVAREALPDDTWCHLIAIGRLEPEKGYDLLFEAIATVRRLYPQVKLRILGEGKYLEKLQKLSSRHALKDQVSFAGFSFHPERELSRSGIFVISSRYEGMPNALLEAAMLGLPIVSTPCSPGLTALVRNVPGVWLAKKATPAAIAEALCSALAEVKALAELTSNPAPRFHHDFVSPFELGPAVGAFEELIINAVQSKVSGTKTSELSSVGECKKPDTGRKPIGA